MKRHPTLVRLSNEHHHALVLARRLCLLHEATPAHNPQDLAKALLDAWQAEIEAHFREEEAVLLPILARHTTPSDHPCVRQMLDDHAWLRAAVWDIEARISGGAPLVEALGGFGERLRAHVRLEEQEVFALIQRLCSNEDCLELTRRLRPLPQG